MRKLLSILLSVFLITGALPAVTVLAATTSVIETDWDSGLEAGVPQGTSIAKGTALVKAMYDADDATKFHRIFVHTNDTAYGDVQLVQYPDTENTVLKFIGNDASSTANRSVVQLALNDPANTLAQNNRPFYYHIKYNASEIADGAYSRVVIYTQQGDDKGSALYLNIYNDRVNLSISRAGGEESYPDAYYDDPDGWQEITVSYLSGGKKTDGMVFYLNHTQHASYTTHSRSVYPTSVQIIQAQDAFRNSVLYVDNVEFGYGTARPTVDTPVLSGTNKAGGMLSVIYTSTAEQKVVWKYSDEADGDYHIIPGAEEDDYTVSARYADRYIKAFVTPADGRLYGLTQSTDPCHIAAEHYDFDCSMEILKDGSDISQTGIEAGDLTAKVTLNNQNGYIDYYPVALMANVYYKGALVSFAESTPLTEIMEGDNEITLPLSITPQTGQSISDYSVKLFLWNDTKKRIARAGVFEFDNEGITASGDCVEICSIDEATATVNDYRREITIDGTLLSEEEEGDKADRRIAMMIASEDEQFTLYEQTQTLSDGSFSLFCKLPQTAPTGTYTVYIKPYGGEEYTTTFNVAVSAEFLSGVLAAINSATTETLGDVFTNPDYSTLFARDYDLYQRLTDSKSSALSSVLTGDYTELGDFTDAYAEKAVTGAFNDASDGNSISYLIENFNDIIKLDVEEGSSFYKLSSESKSRLYALWAEENSYTDTAQLLTSIREDVLLEALRTATWGSVRDIFDEFSDILMLDADDISSADNMEDASEIYKSVIGEKFENAQEVKKAFSAAVKLALTQASEDGEEDRSHTSSYGGGGGTNFKAYVDKEEVAVILPAPEKTVDEAVSFDDLSGVQWAEESILGLAERGIVNGTAENTFSPEKRVTRAEFIKMLVLCFGIELEDGACSFTDVPDDSWFKPYVAAAQRAGIAYGREDGSFGANDYITRQDIAALSYRTAIYANVSLVDVIVPVEFDDYDRIASYAREGIEALQRAGIINGMTETSFAPHENATRAQASKIVYGMVLAKEQNEESEE